MTQQHTVRCTNCGTEWTLEDRPIHLAGASVSESTCPVCHLPLSTDETSPLRLVSTGDLETQLRALMTSARASGLDSEAIVHALRLRPMAVVARALDNRALNDLLERMRTRTGNTVIYRQGTIRRVLRLLHAGEGVGILIDQHIQSKDAIYVDFFDRPAATTSIVAALALRTGAPVIPLFALPLGGGRYRMIYEHPIQPPSANAVNAVHEFTQRCTDVLEMYVRRHPELWLWMHRRWRED